MLSRKLKRTIAVIQEELDSLRPLKGDLVEKVVGLMVVMGDIEENMADYTSGVLWDCPIWYLKNEQRVLGLRADKIHSAILAGLMRQSKGTRPKAGSWNRIDGFF